MELLKKLAKIGLLLFLLLIGFMIALPSLTGGGTTTLNGGPDEELVVSGSAKEQGPKILQALKDTNYFPGTSSATVNLSLNGQNPELTFFVKKEALSSKERIAAFSDLGYRVLSQAYDLKKTPGKIVLTDGDSKSEITRPAERLETDLDADGIAVHVVGALEPDIATGLALEFAEIVDFQKMDLRLGSGPNPPFKIQLIGMDEADIENEEIVQALKDFFEEGGKKFSVELAFTSGDAYTNEPQKVVKF